MPSWRAAAMTASAWYGHAHAGSCRRTASCTSSRPPSRRPLGQDRRQPVDAAGDQLEALAAVVDGVHRGHHGQQHLRRADVGGRLLAADVLLARLQREPQRRIAVGVDRDADEAARQRALEPGAHAHVGGVRAAEADRDAEALRRADDDVGAHLARRLEQHEREQVGGDAGERARRVRPRRSAARGRARGPTRPGTARARRSSRPRAAPRRGRRRRSRCRAARRASAAIASVCGNTSASTTKRLRLGLRRRAARPSSPRPRPSPRRAATRSRSAGR